MSDKPVTQPEITETTQNIENTAPLTTEQTEQTEQTPPQENEPVFAQETQNTENVTVPETIEQVTPPQPQSTPEPIQERKSIPKEDAKPRSEVSTLDKSAVLLNGEIGKKYSLMVQLLTSDPKFAKTLAEVTQPSVHDKLSSSLINITFDMGASLSIIRSLIHLEFARKYQHPSTILRVNSIVSKMTGKYTKKVGDDYLKTVLGEYILEINNQPELNLEANEVYLKGDNPKKEAAENLIKLENWCQKFFDKICDDKIIAQMPRELRAISYFIEASGDTFKLDKETITFPLISGFIMLRYMCPSITLPHLSGILPKLPEGLIRSNLTAIARVLQKMANQEKFDEESTPHLMGLNRFVENNRAKLLKYLKSLATDPLQQNGKAPFADLLQPVDYQDFHLKSFKAEDLKHVHTLLMDTGADFITSLLTEVLLTDGRSPHAYTSSELDFIQLVADMGPSDPKKIVVEKKEETPEKKGSVKVPPPSKSNVGKQEETKPQGKEGEKETKKKEIIDGKSQQEMENIILTRSLNVLMSNIKSLNLTEMEASRFFYLGKPAIDGTPVFYLLFHRLEKKHFDQVDLLMAHLYKTMWDHLKAPFHLVLDFSWMSMSSDFTNSLLKFGTTFVRLLKSEHVDQCKQCVVLHANASCLKVWKDVIISLNDFKSRIVVCNDWTDMMNFVEGTKIWIPFISKKFLPITHRLVSINSKEKKFDRFVKFTHDSILNIDGKGQVRGEIPLCGIQEIRATLDSTDIIIKFTPLEEKNQDPYELMPKTKGFRDEEDATNQTLRYTCQSDLQRDLLIEMIFDIGIQSSSLAFPQTFRMSREFDGKKQPRVVKLTSDSFLVFADKQIKREIAYSSIDAFWTDNSKLIIHYLLNGEQRSYHFVGDDVEVLKNALADAISRMKFRVGMEIDLFKKTKVDSVLDKFFEMCGAQEQFDTKKWKQLLRIDGPIKDLKKLFNKIDGDKGEKTAQVFNADIVKQLNLGLNDAETKHLLLAMDPDLEGFILYATLVSQWIALRKAKMTIQKKKVIQRSASMLVQKNSESK